MTHDNVHLALFCLVITLALQGFAPSMPPALLQAARIVQVLLGMALIYFLAAWILSHTVL